MFRINSCRNNAHIQHQLVRQNATIKSAKAPAQVSSSCAQVWRKIVGTILVFALLASSTLALFPAQAYAQNKSAQSETERARSQNKPHDHVIREEREKSSATSKTLKAALPIAGGAIAT